MEEEGVASGVPEGEDARRRQGKSKWKVVPSPGGQSLKKYKFLMPFFYAYRLLPKSPPSPAEKHTPSALLSGPPAGGVHVQSDAFSKLQALFSEIRNRFFYLLLSFFFAFTISYCYSKSLLYVFALPFVNRSLKNGFLDGQAQDESLWEHHMQIFLQIKDLNLLSPLVAGGTTGNNIFFRQEKMDASTLASLCTSKMKSINSQALPEATPLISLFSLPPGATPALENLLNFCKQFREVASKSFIFTDVEEAFSCQILICLILSFIMIFPIIIYQGFSFFAPSFYKEERQKWVWRGTLIIVSWYFFVYNVQNYCLPKLADFLLKFEISSLAFSLTAETKIKSYCIWAITIFIISNFIFFFIFSILFLIYEQKIKVEYFTVRRQTSRVSILLFSAFLGPPEIQFFLALLGIFIFELIVYFFFIYKQFLYKS